MKHQQHPFTTPVFGWSRVFAVALFGGVLAASSATTNKPVDAGTAAKPGSNLTAGAASAAVTNALPVKIEIPQAVFVWNYKSNAFGRDLFYPETERFKEVTLPKPSATNTQAVVETKVTVPVAPVRPDVPLVLQGLMGRRLATINGRLFAPGDSAWVPIPSGKIYVRCDSIRNRAASVTVTYSDGKSETKDLILGVVLEK